jgi:hypothetical protein
LRGRRVCRLHNEPAPLNRDKVAHGRKVRGNVTQQVAKRAHRSREAKLLFKTQGARRLWE